jgi:hypothetical protein
MATNTFNKTLGTCFLLIVILCLSVPTGARAQGTAKPTGVNAAASGNDWIHDPLKVPDVWKALIRNPIDSSLWIEYYGKNWDKMTIKDYEKINHWKQQLMLKQLMSNEDLIGFVIRPEYRSADFFIDELAFVEFRDAIKAAKEAAKGKNGKRPVVIRAQIAGMEALILSENEELQRLKTNPKANFEMIENMYAEIFTEFKVPYTYYHEKHPDRKYPLIKWIEEKEAELRAIKMKQVEELRAKYQK